MHSVVLRRLRKNRYHARNARQIYATQRENIAELVALKGGKCIRCGYDRCKWALVFHHRDPTTKAFHVSASNGTRSFRDLAREAEKCDLLCSNCHLELHAEIGSFHSDRRVVQPEATLWSMSAEK